MTISGRCGRSHGARMREVSARGCPPVRLEHGAPAHQEFEERVLCWAFAQVALSLCYECADDAGTIAVEGQCILKDHVGYFHLAHVGFVFRHLPQAHIAGRHYTCGRLNQYIICEKIVAHQRQLYMASFLFRVLEGMVNVSVSFAVRPLAGTPGREVKARRVRDSADSRC